MLQHTLTKHEYCSEKNGAAQAMPAHCGASARPPEPTRAASAGRAGHRPANHLPHPARASSHARAATATAGRLQLPKKTFTKCSFLPATMAQIMHNQHAEQ